MDYFIAGLDLPFEGKMSGNEYVINLDNSNDFAALFDAISLNRNLQAADNSLATEDKTIFTYTDGKYEIKLMADYNSDRYSAVIGER